jgi:hypothetical protein
VDGEDAGVHDGFAFAGGGVELPGADEAEGLVFEVRVAFAERVGLPAQAGRLMALACPE